MPLADTDIAIVAAERVTYETVVTESGPSGGGPSGSNKAMATLFNPAASGRQIHLLGYSVQAESSSGTGVIVLYEVRRISAHSGGTLVAPKKRDTVYAASVAEVRDAPASVTEIADPMQQTFILQSNTMQSPMSHFRDLTAGGARPLILREGEGIVMHQVTSNGGTFHIGFVWAEE